MKKILLIIGLLSLQNIQTLQANETLENKIMNTCFDPKVIVASVALKIAFLYYGAKTAHDLLEKTKADTEKLKQIEINNQKLIELENIKSRNTAVQASLGTALIMSGIFGSYLYLKNNKK